MAEIVSAVNAVKEHAETEPTSPRKMQVEPTPTEDCIGFDDPVEREVLKDYMDEAAQVQVADNKDEVKRVSSGG